MCGIFGQLERHLSATSREAFVERAGASLAHRGPDGGTHVFDTHCVLGHRRLKILDLSDAADQPMRSATGRSLISHNGEIYNFVELRAGLTAQGGWRSSGDTEVLLEHFEKHGVGGLSKLIGMFAFAFWQPADRRLFLVRDRLGKKPLYWARTRAGGLRFASEVGGIFADDEVPRRISTGRIAEFLQYGYNTAPETSFVGVQQVPPAHYLCATLTDDGIDIEVTRYWELPLSAPAPMADFGRWADEFGATLGNAVKIRMRSDVPVGAFLSGGVDSSIISMLASREIGGGLRTITADFPAQRSMSEAPYAHEIAVHIEADHRRVELSAPGLDDLNELVRICGELHGDPSTLATIAVSKATREQVSVALTGDGADEVMGGYTRYFQALRASARARSLPRSVVTAAHEIAQHLPAWARGDGTLALLRDDPAESYLSTLRQFPARMTPPLFRVPVESWQDPVTAALQKHRLRPALSQMMAADMETYIPSDTNVSLDRASMAVGLELRSPFLDHRLFELVARARPEWIMDGDRGKQPLRYLYASALPRSVFTREKKGFGVPVESWFRGRKFDVLTDRLLDPRSQIYDVLDRHAVANVVRGFKWRTHRAAGRIWHLLVLDAWLARWKPTIS